LGPSWIASVSVDDGVNNTVLREELCAALDIVGFVILDIETISPIVNTDVAKPDASVAEDEPGVLASILSRSRGRSAAVVL